MTYKDIYNWALMKMENEKKAEKLLGCHIPLMYEQAEKELILECCPKSAMLPMSEISVFNVEEILKSREKVLELKKLLSILENDILKLKDRYKYNRNHFEQLIENGKKGLMTWNDIDEDVVWSYYTTLYEFGEIERSIKDIIKKVDED